MDRTVEGGSNSQVLHWIRKGVFELRSKMKMKKMKETKKIDGQQRDDTQEKQKAFSTKIEDLLTNRVLNDIPIR
jgi:hypothetical protein